MGMSVKYLKKWVEQKQVTENGFSQPPTTCKAKQIEHFNHVFYHILNLA
jgi:hypothetical protein